MHSLYLSNKRKYEKKKVRIKLKVQNYGRQWCLIMHSNKIKIKIKGTHSGEDSGVRLDISSWVGTVENKARILACSIFVIHQSCVSLSNDLSNSTSQYVGQKWLVPIVACKSASFVSICHRFPIWLGNKGYVNNKTGSFRGHMQEKVLRNANWCH